MFTQLFLNSSIGSCSSRASCICTNEIEAMVELTNLFFFFCVCVSSQVPNKKSGSSLKKPLESNKAGSVKKEKSAIQADGKYEHVKHSKLYCTPPHNLPAGLTVVMLTLLTLWFTSLLWVFFQVRWCRWRRVGRALCPAQCTKCTSRL